MGCVVIKLREKYGCLTVEREVSSEEQPTTNGHKLWWVRCSRCGSIKKHRDDRIKKSPTHCGVGGCRTMKGIDIHERRAIEYQLWCTIREMKKSRPTWHYLWSTLKDDNRWEFTGIQDLNPLTMRKWYSRLRKQFELTEEK